MAVSTRQSVGVPSYDRMIWPTVLALRALGGSGTIREIDQQVIALEGLTEEQQLVPHGDGRLTEVSYRLLWSRTYLKAVGAIENSSRGVWTLTDYGRSLTKSEAEVIPRQVRAQNAARPSRQKSKQPSPTAVDTPPEDLTAVEALSSTDLATWRAWLLEALRDMPPAGFERLAQRLLREAGFVRVEVTGRIGDGGIDGIGVLQMQLLSFQVFFQCKRYRGSVGAAAVRDFRGAMVGRTDKGILITTGYFTEDARREATRDGAPALDLIDGDRLCDLLKTYALGVTTRQVDEVTVNPTWFQSL